MPCCALYNFSAKSITFFVAISATFSLFSPVLIALSLPPCSEKRDKVEDDRRQKKRQRAHRKPRRDLGDERKEVDDTAKEHTKRCDQLQKIHVFHW